jgi:hypothetical protein
MEEKIEYVFLAKMWQYNPPYGWYFISLPQNTAHEIRESLQWQEEGWGRMKATAKIGNSVWETSIWFDTKLNTYLLPVKVEIRKTEKLVPGREILITIGI